MRFFAYPTIAAWTALFYVVISSIGVTYSWAFYIQFDDISIFKFFNTPDFLLSAFRDIKTLIIGVSAALVAIGILVYRVYNSGVYNAYKFDRDRYRSEQRSRIRWEAALLPFITLLFIFLISLFFFPWNWSEHPLSMVLLHLMSILILIPLISSRLFRDLLGEERETQIRWEAALLPFITLLFIFLIGIFLFSWDWSEHPLSMVLLHLMSILILIPLISSRLFRNLLGEERETQIKWGGRFLASILLVEGIVILPFLSGVDDSKAALEKDTRPVQVALRRGASEARILPPDRTLLLGTTSSFHIFYECAEALKNADGTPKKCGENGQPFVIPTTNIASLEFKPKEDLPPHVGSPVSLEAIAELDRIIKKLKSEEINVPAAIIQINSIIASFNRSSETHTKLIIPKIESPEPESTAHLGPDQIATAVVAFQSYLEGKTPITHLNETIRNLTDVPDSDLAQIAEAIENLNIPGIQNYCASDLEEVGIIGPFCEGKHDQLEKGTPKKCTDHLVTPDKLENHFKDKTPQHLMLVGRVDKTRFSEEKWEFYGAQIRLARARAEWVHGELLKKFPKQIDPQQITLRTAGPRYVGEDRALDRSVEIWACWASKQAQSEEESAG